MRSRDGASPHTPPLSIGGSGGVPRFASKPAPREDAARGPSISPRSPSRLRERRRKLARRRGAPWLVIVLSLATLALTSDGAIAGPPATAPTVTDVPMLEHADEVASYTL